MTLIVVATIVPGVLLSAPVIPLCGIPLAFAISQLREIDPRLPHVGLPCLLFSFGWALSIGVELVYVRDVFDDRMNTLFKFYYQAWTLFATRHRGRGRRALAGGRRGTVAASGSVGGDDRGTPRGRSPTRSIASYQWTDRFAAWQGLDGLAYGEETDPDDTTAIRWLGGHAAPGDVVLEAAGCSYYPVRPVAVQPRFRVHWRAHRHRLGQQSPATVARRSTGAHRRDRSAARPMSAAMFADPDSPLFDTYGVTWLFVGEYEIGRLASRVRDRRALRHRRAARAI